MTQAYAKAARNLGAEVYRFTRVTALEARPDGTWDVVTDKGTLVAEHVVNAGGLWAREVGRFVGLELPILAMEHQYVITGEIPEVVASPTEMLHVIDFEGEIYMRQEGRGMLIGTYEKAGVPWAERETPWDFTHELLPNDLERIAPSLEVGFRHFPALERAGIKKIINGPFTFAPDGNPLIGPIRGLAQLLGRVRRDGGIQPGRRRRSRAVQLDGATATRASTSGRWTWRASATGRRMAYTNAKVRENYSRRFRIRFPNEELPAARPLRMTPAYDRLKARGAVFGVELRARARAVVRAGGNRSARGRDLPPLERARTRRPTSAARCAMPWACSKSRPSRATKSAARAPRRGSTACSPISCRAKAG